MVSPTLNVSPPLRQVNQGIAGWINDQEGGIGGITLDNNLQINVNQIFDSNGHNDGDDEDEEIYIQDKNGDYNYQ